MRKITLIRLILTCVMLFLAALTIELHFIIWIEPYSRILPYILIALLPIHVALAIIDREEKPVHKYVERKIEVKPVKITHVKKEVNETEENLKRIKIDKDFLNRILKFERIEDEELVEV